MPSSTDRADVVIVGAGSAGCVLAERLSRDSRRRVMVLERGPATPVADARLGVLPIGAASEHARGFGTVDPALSIVRGQGLGGSSAVNGGYFMRWHRSDLADLLEEGPWSADQIERAYAELDAPGGAMSVSPWRDDELTDTSRAFEGYWNTRVPVRDIDDRCPIVGLNRVLSNHSGRQRFSAADGYLNAALSRPNLTVVTDADVRTVRTGDAGLSGVDAVIGGGPHRVDAAEVILCGGTLGTAEILFRSGIVVGDLRLREHREVLVRYRRRRAQAPPPTVLQSVVHDAAGCEIRCYTDDFTEFVAGVPASGPAVGVAAMSPGVPGRLTWDGDGLVIDLGSADVGGWSAADAVGVGIDAVVQMLGAPEFAAVVEPDSVVVEQYPATSQHACATLPLGGATDWAGALRGVGGLRVVDGSILPHAGRSGPHETTMMLACLIGDELIG